MANRRLTVGMSITLIAAVAMTGVAAGRQVLKDHVPPAVAGLRPLEQLAATQQMELAIALPLRNRQELEGLLRELYDPSSPGFRRYLTAEQFTERFGPTEKDYQALIAFAKAKGLTVTGTYGCRTLLDVSGSAGAIEKMLGVRLRVYRHPKEARSFFAPDAAPSIDAPVEILAIDGLDDFELPRPVDLRTRALKETGEATPCATGSGPIGNFMGWDFRAAYAPDVTLDGSGQSVGLLEFDGYNASDINAYETLTGLPQVPLINVLVRGFSGRAGDRNDEVTLDIDMAIAMAPGLSNVVVYESAALFVNDMLTRMAESGAPRQLSSSWWFKINAYTEVLFSRFAAQGQSFFQASGDSGAWLNGAPTPIESTNLTVVGGTVLTTSGEGGPWESESAWPLSGGGISTNHALPPWQQCIDMSTNGGSTSRRNLPDVACVADSIWIVANYGEHMQVAGTSAAAPLWAGFAALANQQAAALGNPDIGFLNPALYAIGKAQGYQSAFHDITNGNNGKYSAVPGYDLCTGWGTPAGNNLVQALVKPPDSIQISPLAALTFSGPVGGPFSPATQSFALANESSAPVSWTATNTAPWLDPGSASGTLSACGAGSVAVSVNSSASSLSAGNYTATLWFTNLDSLRVQSRQVVLDVVTPPVITNQPASQVVFEGMAAAFSVGVSNPASVSYRWQKDNGMYLTNLTDGGNVSGATASTLILSNSSPADAGAYSVVVSNGAGPVISSNAFLAVLSWRPVILAQPTNQTALPGQNACFTVTAAGTQPLACWWQKGGNTLMDGDRISGSTSSSLLISNVSAADAGAYSVLVSNELGVAHSSEAILTVLSNTAAEATVQTLYSFGGGNDGGGPNGLLFGTNGVLYGTTRQGGTNGSGTVFTFSSGGALTTLYSFTGGHDGAEPRATLLSGADGNYYGTTVYGGDYGYGTVFTISASGAFSSLVPLDLTNGAYPVAGLIQDEAGNLFGTAYRGGSNVYYGTVFQVTPNEGLSNVYSFSGLSEGGCPYAGLVRGPGGHLYGTTYLAGLYRHGTVFTLTGNNATALVSFNYTNGGFPCAGLVQGDDGSFYGATAYCGTNGFGALFRVSPDGAFTNLYAFTGGRAGAFPIGTLLLSLDGNFYGTTSAGGAYGGGTVFRMTPDGALLTLAEFDGYDGANPQAPLIEGRDGALYGTTLAGGPAGQGTIFRLSLGSPPQITAQPKSQSVFTGNDVTFYPAVFGSRSLWYEWLKNGTNLTSWSTNRALALAEVTLADAGLYQVIITNPLGSVTSAVAVLEVTESPPIITLCPTNQSAAPGATATFRVRATGSQPLHYQWRFNGVDLSDATNMTGSRSNTLTISNLIETNQGEFEVEISNAFGSANCQAMLEVIPPSPACTRLATMHSFAGGNEGAQPNGLVEGTDGNFYGTTENGGRWNLGTVFRMTPDGAVTNLISFDGTNGANPKASLIQGSDGNFYGTTYFGGAGNNGSVFSITSAGLTTLISFDCENGANPRSALIQAADGNFYGTTSYGGRNTNGTIFRMTLEGKFTNLVSFAYTNGAQPYAALMQASDGQFYGTTYNGGDHGFGTVFKMTSVGTLTTLYSFLTNNANWGMPVPAFPAGTLIQAPDGALYGTTEFSYLAGSWYAGAFYRITTNVPSNLTNLYGFNDYDGHWLRAGVVRGGDGNFYGTTYSGPLFDQNGTVFSLSAAGALTTLLAFDGFNDGANPQAALLLASDGNFYGTTTHGGWNGQGTVFRLSIAPQITGQPANRTAFVGGSANFNVAASGSPLCYQWQKNGIDLADGLNVSGSRGATLSLSNLTAAENNSLYSVVVSNGLLADASCARTSSIALLTVTSSPPVIVQPPATLTVAPAATANFTVGAVGNEPLWYQWQFNGTNLAGATNSSLRLPLVQETNAGSYCVVVSNELGRAVSAAAGLRVLSLLSWQTAGPDLTLTWTGPYVLQASTNVSGPYFDVPGTTSPFVASTLKPRQFFRLRALQAGRLSLGMVANNEFTLTAAGLAGYNYIVEASTNLAVWVPLQTNPAPFVFVDTETTNFGRRFYRTVFSR